MNPACAGVDCEGKQVYSREIKVRLIRAGICCEEMYVYSREINWDTSGLGEITEFRCIFLLKSACAGIHFEEKRVESREINWDTSGLNENPELRCILFWQFLAIHRK